MHMDKIDYLMLHSFRFQSYFATLMVTAVHFDNRGPRVLFEITHAPTGGHWRQLKHYSVRDTTEEEWNLFKGAICRDYV